MSESLTQVAVGDRLWLVERRGRHNVGRPVTIAKIGRKWVSLVNADRPEWGAGRYDKETGIYDNGDFSGGSSIYGTEAEWIARVHLTEKWQLFNQLVRNTCGIPKHLTIDDIATMTRIIQGSHHD